jgi:Uncharacterized lipoprotein
MSSNHCRCRSRAAATVTGGFMIVSSLIGGCAIPVRELPITYVPQENVQPIKDADAVPVEVKVEDRQPVEYITPFTDVTKGRRFRVKDAADTIKSTAETELRARGFKVETGGAVVEIQLIHFEATFEEGFTTTVRAYLSMRVQVLPQTGKALYSEDVRGEGTPISAVFMLHPGALELQRSLEDTFKRLLADPGFTQAILATRQSAPAKPASPGRIAGAFATMSRR